MIRLRVLGTLDLSSDGGETSADLLGQPKRVALLTVLALGSAGGPVSRDKLVGLFWPDLPQARGRRALSQSLYVLRKSLGDDLITAAGNDTLQLETGALWCDAVEFEAAVDRGDGEQALSLYQGDLLDGFHLSDTPEFEHWVDSERARLKQQATGAARDLIDREEARNDWLAAVRWARRLARLAPWDEESLIRLLGLLQRAGDRSGVTHEYELYRKRLESELGTGPSSTVESAFASALEARSEPVADPPRPPVQTAATSEADMERDHSGRYRRSHPWRAGALIGLAVLVAILVVVGQSRQAFDETESGNSLPRVLVVPLANHTGDARLDPLARLAADWLSTEIARSGRVRVVPPVSALRIVAQITVEGDTSTFSRAVAAGAEGGADLVLGGYVSGRPDSAVFEVFGLDSRTGELLFALEPVGPTSVSTEATFERLRRATMGALAGQLDQRMRSWTGAASKPPSYASYQEYSRALDTFLEVDRTSQERAAEMFLDAWRADTTFTAPLIWAIFALWNSGQAERADSVAHSLEPRTGVMPDWDRAMLRYHVAFMHGDLGGQYRAASEVVELAPDSEWRYILALAARQVGCRDEALATLRDLGSRSGWMNRWAPAYWQVRLDVRHLTGDAVGEAHDADQAFEQLTDEMHPGDEYRALAAHIRAAAVSGSQSRLESYLAQVRGLGRRGHRLYMKLLYWGPFDLASARPEYRTILDSARVWYADRPAAERDASWYLFARWVLAYRGGMWTEAQRYADDLVETGWPVAPEYNFGPRALLAARNGQPARARAILDSVPVVPHGRAYADYDPDFFRARLDAILGDPALAVEHLRAANRQGIPYEEVLAMGRIDFEAIWDYPPLQRLVAGHSCEGM